MDFIDSHMVIYMGGAFLIVVCGGFLMNVVTECIQTVYRQKEERAKREKKAKREQHLDKAS